MEMARESSTCDASTWQVVDVLDALDGPAFNLDPEFITSDLYWSEDFNVTPPPSSNADSSREQGLEANLLQTAPMHSHISTTDQDDQHLYSLTAPHDLVGNQFNDVCLLMHMEDLRSHQLLTTFSHAPFVPSHPLHLSPNLRQSSSPEPSLTYSESEDDTQMRDSNFYGLPDISFVSETPQALTSVTMPPISSNRASRVIGLTPLEMPDGSTRMTTNWLPVDCEGGFIIAGLGGEVATFRELPDQGHIFDTMLLPRMKDAVLSMEFTVPALGG